MGKPFQFSIRWMLFAMALLGVDAWLLAVLPQISLIGRFALLGLPLGLVTGTAIGCLWGKPFTGAALGAIAYYALFSVFILAALLLGIMSGMHR